MPACRRRRSRPQNFETFAHEIARARRSFGLARPCPALSAQRAAPRRRARRSAKRTSMPLLETMGATPGREARRGMTIELIRPARQSRRRPRPSRWSAATADLRAARSTGWRAVATKPSSTSRPSPISRWSRAGATGCRWCRRPSAGCAASCRRTTAIPTR